MTSVNIINKRKRLRLEASSSSSASDSSSSSGYEPAMSIPKTVTHIPKPKTKEKEMNLNQFLTDNELQEEFQKRAIFDLKNLSPAGKEYTIYSNDDIMNKEIDILVNMKLQKRKCKDESLENMLRKIAFMRAALNYLLINCGYEKMDFKLHNPLCLFIKDFKRIIAKTDLDMNEIQLVPEDN